MDLSRLVRIATATALAVSLATACSVEADPSTVGLVEVSRQQAEVETAETAETVETPAPTQTQAATETPAATATAEPASPDATQDLTIEAVQVVFEEYRAALLALDGQRASQVVTPSTITYYDRILDLGLHAEAEELLTSTSLSEALGVLAMRARLGADLLEISDGGELFMVGVDLGLVGDNVSTVEFDGIEIDDRQAFGVLEDLQVMRFENVDGEWFVDLPFTTAFIDDNEEDFVASLTNGSTDRTQLFDLVALGYGTTWAALSLPPR